MFGLQSKQFSVVAAEPKNILHACKMDIGLMSKNIPFARLLKEYLSGVSAKCAVIEHSYIDKDYLEDFSSYYSRCFKDYKRRCKRIHFFKDNFTVKDIETIVVDEKAPKLKSLIAAYLGFIVVRPLQETVVGRTCLEPYAQNGTGRYYPATCNVEASLFGVRLKIKCMPFQEQDENVAACATCALWSAFYVAAECFGCEIHSPSYITASAMSHGLSKARGFPNKGVSEEDMIYAVRRAGLDPVVVDFSSTDSIMCANKFLGNVYAYLKYGIAVIAVVKIKNKDGSDRGVHAVAINGYHIDNRIENGTERGNGLYACGIDKLYANDDQIVPYSRIVVDKKNLALELISNWRDLTDTNWHCKFEPISLIVPVYRKIRVSYEEVWKVANEFDSMIQGCHRLKSSDYIEWDIYLQTSNDYKDMVRSDQQLSRTEKFRILLSSLPRYLWNVCVRINNTSIALFCIDATDSGQGLQVATAIFYTRDLINLAKKTMKVYRNADTNILCAACLD